MKLIAKGVYAFHEVKADEINQVVFGEVCSHRLTGGMIMVELPPECAGQVFTVYAVQQGIDFLGGGGI